MMLARSKKFDIGVRVRSKQVGSRVPFTGTIVEKMHSAWHVLADDDGQLWHRTSRELSLPHDATR
jgi:hypothetical protein